jgi:hypothetical protein
MINKTFLKSTEALIVFGGLFLTLTLGKFWAIATAAAYLLVNAPNLWQWIKERTFKTK